MPEPLSDDELADLTLAFDDGLLAVIAWVTAYSSDCYDAGLVAGSCATVDRSRHGGGLNG